MITEKVTIRRIGPSSALKAGAAVGLVLGVLYAVLGNLFIDDSAGRLALLCGVVFSGAVGGGVSALVAAWVYNIALNLTGGLQLEISVENDGAAASKGKHGSQTLGDFMQDDK